MSSTSKQPRNLAFELHELIKAQSPDCAQRWMSLFIERDPVKWQFSPALPEDTQMVEINAYWRWVIGLENVDTLQARSCIIDGLSYDHWISNYQRFVIPVIVQLNLPKMG